ncbi:hypothetical protein LCGC14_0145520 [marine sediment metagenome]|uniref:Uncharacterized protein n=1 Tax=marine sediment metagenome TaxID=412755 RepID=A0A0F9VF90_9ZZZZ
MEDKKNDDEMYYSITRGQARALSDIIHLASSVAGEFSDKSLSTIIGSLGALEKRFDAAFKPGSNLEAFLLTLMRDFDKSNRVIKVEMSIMEGDSKGFPDCDNCFKADECPIKDFKNIMEGDNLSLNIGGPRPTEPNIESLIAAITNHTKKGGCKPN